MGPLENTIQLLNPESRYQAIQNIGSFISLKTRTYTQRMVQNSTITVYFGTMGPNFNLLQNNNLNPREHFFGQTKSDIWIPKCIEGGGGVHWFRKYS